MSVFIVKAWEHFFFSPHLSFVAFCRIFRPAVFTAIRARAESHRAPFFWIFALIVLVSAAIYVVSMNIILFEGRRAALFERVLREEQGVMQVLRAERATLRSPSAVKARAAIMGMTEVLQIHFVSEEEMVAATRGRPFRDPF